MILDSIAKTFLTLAGITSNLKQPSVAIVSYGLLDAQTDEPALWVRNGVLYDRTGTALLAIGSTGGLTSPDPDGGLGYSTGAGGAITQGTSKSTAVTLHKVCGSITMHNAALAAGAEGHNRIPEAPTEFRALLRAPHPRGRISHP
jgi:hypothetical protein